MHNQETAKERLPHKGREAISLVARAVPPTPLPAVRKDLALSDSLDSLMNLNLRLNILSVNVHISLFQVLFDTDYDICISACCAN